jgi:CDGSH-type Zn-finger protein
MTHYTPSDTIALCRCGHSNTKPYCDGTHEKTNFAAINRHAPAPG